MTALSGFVDAKGFVGVIADRGLFRSRTPPRLAAQAAPLDGDWVRRAQCLLLGLCFLCAAGCDDHDPTPGYPTPTPTGVIQHPTTMNLYPSTDGNRLYVLVTSVGSQSVNMPLAFDTGSAGITLYAPAIFPPDMINSDGLVFPSGEDVMTFNGIIVINKKATRSYGGTKGTVETGYIGFAPVTFGDAQGALTTELMPVFLYYEVTNNQPPHAPVTELQQGFFGVNSAADSITMLSPTLGAVPNMPCSIDSAADCYVVSVFKYLQYDPRVNAGFTLSPATLQACNIFDAGNCAPAPILTVGLIQQLESEFDQVTLTCPQGNQYLGPAIIQGYSVCNAQIPFTTVTVSGDKVTTTTLTEDALFDSGNPAVDIYQSGGGLPSTLPMGTSVKVETPSGFTYAYTAQPSGTEKTTVGTSHSTGIGVHYFTEHSFFIDFAQNIEGWM
jgi:hypothetical protein